jgi:hypothetical protein
MLAQADDAGTRALMYDDYDRLTEVINESTESAQAALSYAEAFNSYLREEGAFDGTKIESLLKRFVRYDLLADSRTRKTEG